MKKLSLLFLLTIVLSGMIFAQTITITHPITGETVVKGAAYTVQWTKSGIMAATVKIRLWNSTNTTKILNIVDSTANNGSYLCAASMFNGVPEGNYVIRVKTTDNAVVGVSGVFHLSASTTGTIGVTTPASGVNWYKNKSYNITWTHQGSMANTVKIRLYDSTETTKIMNIVDSTANDGSHPWGIPGSVATGNYKIKVKTTDNAVEGFSDVFKIKNTFQAAQYIPIKAFKMEIKVTSPAAGKYWDEGKNYFIKWKNKYTKYKEISIDLYFGSVLQKHIKTITPHPAKMYFSDTSSTPWTIPYDIFKIAINKGWKIKITRTDNTNIKGYSGKFYVRNASSTKKYKLYATIYNKVKWSKKSKKEFLYYETPASDPGPGKMRVGYENFNNDSSSSSYIYRSYLMFNTNNIKGFVKSAKLRYTVFMGPAGCITHISNVDGDWGTNFFGVPVTYITNPDTQLKGFIQIWLNNPETNHGLVFSGAEEHFKQWGNNSCVAFADNVYLELEILENK